MALCSEGEKAYRYSQRGVFVIGVGLLLYNETVVLCTMCCWVGKIGRSRGVSSFLFFPMLYKCSLTLIHTPLCNTRVKGYFVQHLMA